MSQKTSTIIQWVIIILIIPFFIFFPQIKAAIRDIHLSWIQIIVLSLSISFTWVKVLKWGKRKPFNCMKCMTGWTALIIGFMSFGWPGLFFIFIGIFVGSIFEAITLRWL